jgi:hypothetical protein
MEDGESAPRIRPRYFIPKKHAGAQRRKRSAQSAAPDPSGTHPNPRPSHFSDWGIRRGAAPE